MKKTKVLVFVLLAVASLMLQLVLGIGKPDGQSKICCPLGLVFTSILQTVEGGKAAEVRPKVVRVVYLTASRICACSQELCVRGDQLIAQIFVGERQKLLRVIDLAKDPQAAEQYLEKLNQAFQVPMVLFVDARNRILWHTGGVFSREAILKKLGEVGG